MRRDALCPASPCPGGSPAKRAQRNLENTFRLVFLWSLEDRPTRLFIMRAAGDGAPGAPVVGAER